MKLGIFNKRNVSIIMVTIATIIWGFTFIAQSEGAKYVEPFFFSAARFWIGAACIFPLTLLRAKKEYGKVSFWTPIDDKKLLFKGAIIDGTVIFLGMSLQQMGMGHTAPSKAGFLVSLSIVFVPLIGLFLGQKVSLLKWLGVFGALIGVAMMSLTNDFSINIGDILLIASAFFIAINTMVSGHFNKKVESLKYTMFRFVFAAIMCSIISLIMEETTMEMVKNALPAILFAGIFSSGVAFTLQSFGQIHLDDITTQMILSLDSVFSAFFAWIVLGQVLNGKELIGCVIVFASITFIQLLEGREANNTEKNI